MKKAHAIFLFTVVIASIAGYYIFATDRGSFRVEETFSSFSKSEIIATGEEERYEGEVPGGGHYEGEVREGVPHGTGVYITAQGGRYEGEFDQGLPHGKGVYTQAGGTRYEGGFDRGEMKGQGVYIFKDGRQYEAIDGEVTGKYWFE